MQPNHMKELIQSKINDYLAHPSIKQTLKIIISHFQKFD